MAWAYSYSVNSMKKFLIVASSILGILLISLTILIGLARANTSFREDLLNLMAEKMSPEILSSLNIDEVLGTTYNDGGIRRGASGNLGSANTWTDLQTFQAGFISQASSSVSAGLQVGGALNASSTFQAKGLSTLTGGFLSSASSSFSDTINFASSSLYKDDSYAVFGDSYDVGVGWNTSQTVDSWYHGTADGQNVYIIGEYGDRNFDHAVAAQTNPSLYVFSAAQSTNQYIKLSAGSGSQQIQTGTGDLLLTIAGSDVVLSTSNAYGMGAYGSAWKSMYFGADGAFQDWKGTVTTTYNAGNLSFTGGSYGFNTTTPMGNVAIGMSTNTPSFVIWNQSSSTPAFIVRGTAFDGNVGINTSTPWRDFAVNGTVALAGLPAPSITDDLVCIGADNDLARQATNCTVSDIRKKENISPFTSGLDFIRQLEPIQYDEKNGGKKNQVGLSAQAVAKADSRFAVPYEDIKDGDWRTVDYMKLTIPLINSVQELERKVEAQTKEIEELKKNQSIILSVFSALKRLFNKF